MSQALVPVPAGGAVAPFDPLAARVTLRDELELWQECFEFAKSIALTPFIPEAIRGKPDAVMATIIRGHELGISAFESLQKIDFIKGRPALRSELMRALILRAGHSIRIEESTNTRVTLIGQRAGEEHVTKVTWTADDVNKAGLANNENHKKYPRAMLLARATGELARAVFADVLAGMSYTTEEVEAGWISDDDEIAEAPAAELEPAPAPAPTHRAKNPTAKAKGTRRRPRPSMPTVEDVPAPPLPTEDIDDAEIIEDPEPPVVPDASDHVEEPEAAGGEPDEVVQSRAQQIAMRAQKAGVDHHQVVAAVTNGRATSAKDIDAAEGSQILEALVGIAQGRLFLDTAGDVPRIVHDQPAAAAVPTASYEWGEPEWRTFLSDHGVKVTALLAEAQRLAKIDGDTPPTSLADLAGRDSLCELLVSYVETLDDRSDA